MKPTSQSSQTSIPLFFFCHPCFNGKQPGAHTRWTGVLVSPCAGFPTQTIVDNIVASSTSGLPRQTVTQLLSVLMIAIMNLHVDGSDKLLKSTRVLVNRFGQDADIAAALHERKGVQVLHIHYWKSCIQPHRMRGRNLWLECCRRSGWR